MFGDERDRTNTRTSLSAIKLYSLRYRDIADRLIISDSTVKFHMNNALKKLKAQTRYQALHQAIVNGLIQ